MTATSPLVFPTDAAAARDWLDRLWQPGREFLGCDLAILGGAMTWVSERNLVAAISNGGGFGVLAAGSMPPEKLAEEIEGTRALTDKPFGVNLITLHPQLDALIGVCRDMNVSHVVLAGGLPASASIKQAKEGGAKVICFAPAQVIARRLIKMGVDALIIEGNEAGGHVGPVATGVLAQEILPVIRDIPVFVAGGIGRGEMLLAYLEMGAAGCQLGSVFVCAQECIAHTDFKKAFVKASARDAVLSMQIDPRFPVIPVRALANEGTRGFQETQQRVIGAVNAGTLDPKQGQLEIEHFWAGALRRAAIDGDIVTGSLMAGQSVGLVREEQSTASILSGLVEQAVQALLARAERLQTSEATAATDKGAGQ